jgi:hypothetical protein
MPSRSFLNTTSGGPTSKYLQSQNPFANNVAAFTLCAWVYLTASPILNDGSYFPIFTKGFVSGPTEDLQGPSLYLFANADGSIQIWAERTYTGNNATVFSLLPVGAINLNEWTHIAFTLGADLIPHAFVNGVETPYDGSSHLLASGTPSLDDSSYPWNIGVDVPGDANAAAFIGQMSDVRIYSRALSGGELQLLAAFEEPATTSLEARWKMCGDGATEADSSGHNRSLDNHGTVTSSTQPFAFCTPANVSQCVPNIFSSGSTVQFSRLFADYLAPDWTYKIYWNGAAGKFSALGVAQSDGSFLVTLTPTDSNQPAGVYNFLERLTNAASGAVKDFTCPQSITQVLPNPETANAGDYQTWEAKTLAVIQQALLGNMSDQIQSYQIAGRAVSKYSLDQLKNFYGMLKSIVWRQQHPGVLGPQYLVQFPPNEMPLMPGGFPPKGLQ